MQEISRIYIKRHGTIKSPKQIQHLTLEAKPFPMLRRFASRNLQILNSLPLRRLFRGDIFGHRRL